jgi:hypothetical protein
MRLPVIGNFHDSLCLGRPGGLYQLRDYRATRFPAIIIGPGAEPVKIEANCIVLATMS